ncbi:hypothetical protein MJO28_002594 [Puccinia striiformis f. sp. tritici]|uniref:Uncharacterized protein n=2 Tax=Puccinia striiformis TaxID=27350 RepID=A0A2S4V8T9_9BASI|nr:hypothetical protein Pst134EA_005447 [Puccinia striiformis f. sp. tritici]KAI9618937.1 hypothetical protein H4Q26_012194 [Puccinia striiformis f. sp. tritici PST-130]POW05885.1 hypothetical protein PSHT_10580 [Puccinia striiformis]KAH9462642.1 hypothetical protein Pst134EB_006528 [Puccinia striiformis f. sp. tritici]KAH9471554.1 hypothetical protein Pst134EA_005447 [Puccinia striiformis f. sp. tritici]KAI7958803.1 hypothetical protein MJO28_002594 [Puccinia striiformis f. sp. tritici]
MTLQLKALLVLATALTVFVNFSFSTTLCGDWYNKLGKKGQTLEVKLLKSPSWRIKEKGSGRPTRELTADVGICETYTNITRGGCLWIGDNPRTATPKGLTPGWLTDKDKSNCGKQFIIKQGHKHVRGKVVDGCGFGDDGPKVTTGQGCSAIYVTKVLYAELGGNIDDPKDSGTVHIDAWDFAAKNPPV